MEKKRKQNLKKEWRKKRKSRYQTKKEFDMLSENLKEIIKQYQIERLKRRKRRKEREEARQAQRDVRFRDQLRTCCVRTILNEIVEDVYREFKAKTTDPMYWRYFK